MVEYLGRKVWFDLSVYAKQTIEHYLNVTKSDKVKPASTPFLPDGSITEAEEEAKGELASSACSCLMKALWLARLGRPDLLRPITYLATKIQKWSKGDDKRLARIMGYLQQTVHYQLTGYCNDEKKDLYL